jgi:hypothetical protein
MPNESMVTQPVVAVHPQRCTSVQTTQRQAARNLSVVMCLAAVMGLAQAQAAAATAQPVELTIETLVKLRQAELQEEFNQRVKKLFPAPTPVAAPARAASAPQFFMPPAPPPPNRVAAIYGRVGAEMADIELSSGQLRRVVAGDKVGPYTITSIKASGVELKGFVRSKDSPAAQSANAAQKASAKQGKAQGKDLKRSSAETPAAASSGPEEQEVTIRVPLGGTFES